MTKAEPSWNIMRHFLGLPVIFCCCVAVLVITVSSGAFAANQNHLAVQTETGEQQSIAETEEALLEFATSNSVIGLNPAYVEKRLGIPRIKNAWLLQFELGGCTIDYTIEGSEVKSFDVSINQKCQPTIDGTRITERTTFGELKRMITVILLPFV